MVNALKCSLCFVSSALLAIAPLRSGATDAVGCLLTPSKVIEVGSPSIGIIKQVRVDKGDTVKAHQVLMSLSSDVESANLKLAVARADADAELYAADSASDFAKRKYQRTLDLFHQNFVSAQAVEQASADLQAAEGRRLQATEQSRFSKREADVAEAQLDNRTIRSPIDGVVVDIYRHEGERVEEKPILKVVSIDPLYAEVVMPLNLHGVIKPGDEVSVRPIVAGTAPVRGVVRIVDQLIDPSSNSFRVRIVVSNPNHAVPAGARCDVTLPDGRETSAWPTVPTPPAPVQSPKTATEFQRLASRRMTLEP